MPSAKNWFSASVLRLVKGRTAIDVLRAFGLGSDDFVARYSDRGLVSAVLAELGVPVAGQPAVPERGTVYAGNHVNQVVRGRPQECRDE